jgi:putative transposase
MLVFEFKAYGKKQQFEAVDEAIRTVQFIRNKALRFWMENEKVNKYDLNKYSAVLAKEWTFAMNSTAWLDNQAQKERGRQSPDSTTTVKRKSQEKRVFRSFRKTIARSNIKRQGGGWQLTENLSLLPIKKASENSS